MWHCKFRIQLIICMRHETLAAAFLLETDQPADKPGKNGSPVIIRGADAVD